MKLDNLMYVEKMENKWENGKKIVKIIIFII